MPQEIELKLRIDDSESTRAILSSNGAQRAGLVLETNRIFDTPAGDLLSSDCGLRVRTVRTLDGTEATGASLTYKGPRNRGELKHREEVETAVSDPESCAAILRRLGYREKVAYEKRRETWRLGDCEVVIDELPKAGWFVEIEGRRAEDVYAVRDQLKLAETAIVNEPYVGIAARLGRETEAGARELLFSE